MPSGPSTTTVKRLFAASGNRCAFPNCSLPLVDRHGFDNLVLLCPTHHKIVDADPDTYTVQRLQQIKREHQGAQTGTLELSDAQTREFLIQTEGQSGGVNVAGGTVQADEIVGRDQYKITQQAPLPPYDPPPLPEPATLAEPGTLPPGSRLPFDRNALFTGRREPLLALTQALAYDAQPSALITQAIAGMGGVGKTQLAVEFAYRYGRYLHGVHWLNARDPAALEAEVAACGAAMALPRWPEAQAEQVALTLRTWQQGGSRLVVLDNLEDVAAARRWLARLRGGQIRVLITARQQGWPPDLGLARLPMRAFSPPESAAFLRRHLPPERATAAEIDALAQRLYHLPLAEELAGRYLVAVHPSVPIGDYLARLDDVFADRSMTGVWKKLDSPTGHDLRLAETFATSWRAIEDERACRVLAAAGYCAPNEPIPVALLGAAAGLVEKPEACDEALDVLYGLGLLERAPGGPAIHPLVAEYVRAAAGDAEGVLAALGATLDERAGEANASGLPDRFTPLRPHVAAALASLDVGQDPSVLAAKLWNRLGWYLDDVAEYAGARAAYERALAIDEAVYGPDHPEVAIRVNNLGSVLQDLGDLAGARAAFQRALAIWERFLPADHPHIGIARGNLEQVKREMGEG